VRSLLALAGIICATIIACSGPAIWSAPAWGLAAICIGWPRR